MWGSHERRKVSNTVVEACQKKRSCKFHTSPKTFGGDPCPGVRKYVEVAYKCRPCLRCEDVDCSNHDAFKLPNPLDCHSYCQCNLGMAFHHPCPPEFQFNWEKQECDWPRLARCNENNIPYPSKRVMSHPIDTSGIKSGCENLHCTFFGGYEKLPHPNDCNSFCSCIFGVNVRFHCPADLHFNAESKMCESPLNSKCKMQHDAAVDTPGCHDVSCPQNSKIQLEPHPSNISSFCVCVAGKVAVEVACPEYTQFNKQLETCDVVFPPTTHATEVNRDVLTAASTPSLSQEDTVIPAETTTLPTSRHIETLTSIHAETTELPILIPALRSFLHSDILSILTPPEMITLPISVPAETTELPVVTPAAETTGLPSTVHSETVTLPGAITTETVTTLNSVPTETMASAENITLAEAITTESTKLPVGTSAETTRLPNPVHPAISATIATEMIASSTVAPDKTTTLPVVTKTTGLPSIVHAENTTVDPDTTLPTITLAETITLPTLIAAEVTMTSPTTAPAEKITLLIMTPNLTNEFTNTLKTTTSPTTTDTAETTGLPRTLPAETTTSLISGIDETTKLPNMVPSATTKLSTLHPTELLKTVPTETTTLLPTTKESASFTSNSTTATKIDNSTNTSSTAEKCDDNLCVTGEKYVRMPKLCSGYCHCDDGIAITFNCPENKTFNLQRQVCEEPEEPCLD
ncbi:hypothetical protein B566_EDAN010324 [Ephemera danica]|nr:hypothetical protein B566_EDAN010324 [Ephemera danica]